MQSYQHHIAELKHSPQLPEAIEELNAFWHDEQARRLQFYEDLDEDMKAEFIDGEVVTHSPAKNGHTQTRRFIERLFGTYVDVHQLGLISSEHALIALARNDFEPDVCFWSPEKARSITKQTMKHPVPDWVCEILSPGSIRNDRVVKMTDYALNGIPEYWIVDMDKQVVEIYLLGDDSQYCLNIKTNSGSLSCEAIKGLEFPIESLFEMEANLQATFSINSKKD